MPCGLAPIELTAPRLIAEIVAAARPPRVFAYPALANPGIFPGWLVTGSDMPERGQLAFNPSRLDRLPLRAQLCELLKPMRVVRQVHDDGIGLIKLAKRIIMAARLSPTAAATTWLASSNSRAPKLALPSEMI
jgi:hypothetical protein